MENKKYATVDETKRPVITVRFTGVRSTDANFSQYLDDVASCYRDDEHIAIVFDASKASLPHSRHLQQQADWLKANSDMMSKSCAGTAYIIPNAMVRAILQMIFSLQKQPVPYAVFPKEDEAVQWAEGMLLSTASR